MIPLLTILLRRGAAPPDFVLADVEHNRGETRNVAINDRQGEIFVRRRLSSFRYESITDTNVQSFRTPTPDAMRHRIQCNLATRNETHSEEDFDVTPLVKTKNIAMAVLEVAGSGARRLAKSPIYILLLLGSAAATADNPPVPTQIVDLANKVDGVHPGFRAFHAKGVVVEGSLTARFSDGSGMPNVPDGSRAMPRGIATTGEDFRDLLQAIVASPPDAPKPTKLEQFFASHPNAPKAIGSLPIPDSFADEEYHGIDAFIFVSKNGQRQAVRYLIVPEKLVHITPEEAAKQSPDYLFDDLTKRIARKALVFHLKALLAEPGDQTKDASRPWPDDRKVVDLGVLTLNKVVPNSLEAQKKLLFLPRTSPPVSNSPTIRCRSCALPPMASRTSGAANRSDE